MDAKLRPIADHAEQRYILFFEDHMLPQHRSQNAWQQIRDPKIFLARAEGKNKGKLHRTQIRRSEDLWVLP